MQKRLRGITLDEPVFSPNGRRFAVVARDDPWNFRKPWRPRASARNLVRIHETVSGETLLAFPASTSTARDLTFSPDGRRLALINGDGTIEVWDLPE